MIHNNYPLILPTVISLLAAASLPSAAHAWGGGSASRSGSGSVSTARGGSASWSHSASASGARYGGAAAAYHGGGYHGGGAYYGGGYSSGQVAGAAVAGLAVGAMVGSAAAKSSAPPPSTTTVIVQESPGATVMPIGAQVSALPGNCASASVGGVEYYDCGPNWFKPYFGNSSVYYKVVPAPY